MAVDVRFYRVDGTLSAASIASRVGYDAGQSDDIALSGIAAFDASRATDLSFFEGAVDDWPKQGTSAGLCLVRRHADAYPDTSTRIIPVDDPRSAFVAIAKNWISPVISTSETPAIHASANIAETAFIGGGAAIGAEAQIGPYAHIGPGVQIGHGTRIGSHASVTFSLIGNEVTVLAGARLGETGFGLLPNGNALADIPHFGRVILQDRVTVGANTCIDRGFLGDTIIGENTKIDNLCHIGHNTQIGRSVVMAAFAGISGSVTIGDGVRMGGRVGIVDHVDIGKGAQLAADAAVFKSVPAGETWAGSPARPLRDWQRETVWLRKQIGRKGKP